MYTIIIKIYTSTNNNKACVLPNKYRVTHGGTKLPPDQDFKSKLFCFRTRYQLINTLE